MFRSVFTLCLLFGLCCSAQGQSETVAERFARLEANNAQIAQQLNGISAMQSRLQSDVTDLKVEIQSVKDKLDALAKVAAPKAT